MHRHTFRKIGTRTNLRGLWEVQSCICGMRREVLHNGEHREYLPERLPAAHNHKPPVDVYEPTFNGIDACKDDREPLFVSLLDTQKG